MSNSVPQSGRASHTLYPPEPFLLSAPHIAGLLPARVESSKERANAAPDPFIFDRPALADLSAPQRVRLFEAAETLLENALGFMLGGLNEEALRAAEIVFHRAAGGQSAIRPLGPAAFNAEVDADWLEMLARAKRSRPITSKEAETIVQQARAVQAVRYEGSAASESYAIERPARSSLYADERRTVRRNRRPRTTAGIATTAVIVGGTVAKS